MVSWIIILLGIIGLYIFIKSTGFQYSSTWTWFIGGLVIFVLVTFGYVITRPEVHVNDLGGLANAIKIYFVWLGSLFDQASSITGNVVNTDWTSNLTVPEK